MTTSNTLRAPAHTCEPTPAHTVCLPHPAVWLLDGRYLGEANTAEDLHHCREIAAKQRDGGKSPRIFWARSAEAKQRLAVVKHLWVEYGDEIDRRRAHTAKMFDLCRATTGNGTRWWRAWDRYQTALHKEMDFPHDILWATE